MGIDVRNKFDYSEWGVSGTATKNTTTNIDIKITGSQEYITGGQVLYRNAEWGDYLKAQVVDIDNVLGLGAGTVLNEYVHKRYIHPNETRTSLETPYGGLVPQNTYLRLVYVSTGTTNDVDVVVNYGLHHDNAY